jgi:hypothetical protein
MALLILSCVLSLNKRALEKLNKKGLSFILNLSLDFNIYNLLNLSINPKNSVLKSSVSYTIEGGEWEFITTYKLLETL